ncbi:MAG TPA: hypothetical protein VJT78_13495 [Candidatus Dormibacteraeota bacterium]|nr:hypothetical protein [Candidatus Dormibacteraeota bacterium]
MSRSSRPRPSSFFANLGAGPYNPIQRVRLIVTNIGRKTGGEGCCGHYGEPGC